MRLSSHKWLLLAACFLLSNTASADPLAAPGDLRLRHDLQLLNDAGVIDVPLTAWPIPLGNVDNGLQDVDVSDLSVSERDAYLRVRDHLAWELEDSVVRFRFGLSGAENPRIVRGFENTPREEGEAHVGLRWFGERLSVNLSATYVSSPFDDEELRPDGTYVGVALGNWLVTAGWQERWWGPSRDGSLIMGSNARPSPGIAVQRNMSLPYKTKWLSWMGPWTFTTFMTELDDDREIENALLFGMRGSFRPPGTGLEIGISRTAQWCGDDRPCDAGIFWNLLLGKDNQGVNVDPDREPGNQLGGFDVRWRLPKGVPASLYMQWIGEDGRGGGEGIGNWLRQVGAEFWGRLGNLSHRTHVEVSDSTSRQGGFGFSEIRPDYAYEHYIYRTGYRYNGRPIGYPGDSDTLAYSLGSTLVQSDGPAWNVVLRYMEINRVGTSGTRHTISSTQQNLMDAQVSYERFTKIGRFNMGLGASRWENQLIADTTTDVFGFIRWSSN